MQAAPFETFSLSHLQVQVVDQQQSLRHMHGGGQHRAAAAPRLPLRKRVRGVFPVDWVLPVACAQRQRVGRSRQCILKLQMSSSSVVRS